MYTDVKLTPVLSIPSLWESSHFLRNLFPYRLNIASSEIPTFFFRNFVSTLSLFHFHFRFCGKIFDSFGKLIFCYFPGGENFFNLNDWSWDGSFVLFSSGKLDLLFLLLTATFLPEDANHIFFLYAHIGSRIDIGLNFLQLRLANWTKQRVRRVSEWISTKRVFSVVTSN